MHSCDVLKEWIFGVDALYGLKVVFKSQEAQIEIGGIAPDGAAEVLPDSRKVYIFGQ